MATPVPPRSRAPRRIAVGIVVLLVVLLVADRGGKYAGEQIAGNTIRTSQHLATTPDVDVAGFPFLTQFADGKYDRITLTANHVPVGSDSVKLQLTRLRVVLHAVTVSRDFSTFHATSAVANGLVSYADLGRLLGVTLRYGGDGRVRAAKSITVLGRTFSGSVTAEPKVVDDVLSFGSAEVDGGARLAQAAVDLLTQVFHVSLPLQGLPFHVRVKSLSAGAAGLQIELTGADLAYSN